MRALAAALLAAALLAAVSAAAEPTTNAARPEGGTTAPSLAASTSAASKPWSPSLERELMSPYCPGRSLIECPSEKAVELRLWIHAQERAGASRASVEALLFEQFGDQLRHGPRAEGWGLMAYLVPGAALLAGGAFVVGFLRRQGASSAPAAPAATPPADPEIARQIDRELDAS